MIIIKHNFEDFLNAKDGYIYDEMARPPVRFKNPKTGDFEDENFDVSTRMPIFTDKYDIFYLYQFPPEYWAAAWNARYNRFLYDAAKQGDNYNDIQDVVLTGQGGPIVFKNRNTFASHLVDKIKRDVDVDFFRTHGIDPQHVEKFEKKSAAHKAAGEDMGGYIGASMDDPTEFPDKKTWAAKGFISPGAIDDNLNAWMKGSSEGWLEDLDKVQHAEGKIAKRGGGRPVKGAAPATPESREKQVKVFAGTDLQRIQQEMKAAHATPFRILGNHTVAWPSVEKKVKNKTEFFPLFTHGMKSPHEAGMHKTFKGQSIPMLFPGKNVNINDIDAYEADKNAIARFKNFSPEDADVMQHNLDPKIRQLQDELDRGDLEGWDDKLTGKRKSQASRKRTAIANELEYLKHLDSLRNELKDKNPGRPLDYQFVKNAIPGYVEKLNQEMKRKQNTARKYGPYEYAIHTFNRERHGHDPLGVGMENPLILGDPKYPSLGNNVTQGMGSIAPTRQSPQLLHGEEGEWESKYQKQFGHGFDELSGKFRNPNLLDADDHKEIEKKTKEYLGAIASKLSKDQRTMEFLDLNPTDTQHLDDLDFLKERIKAKLPDAAFGRDGRISSTEERIPELLRKAFNEIRDTVRELNTVGAEVESGSLSSAIADGVEKFVKGPSLAGRPELKAAMETRIPQLAINAENFVRRNIGESAFRNYADALSRGAKGAEKRKLAQDLRDFITSRAYSYTGSLAQLAIEGLFTRRIHQGKRKMQSLDKENPDTGDSMSANIAQGQKLSPEELDRLINSAQSGKFAPNVAPDLFKGGEKSAYRRYRTASDEYKGAGHNVNLVHQLLTQAQTSSSTRESEDEMMQGISASVALFNIFKQMTQREAQRAGKSINEKEANSEARKKLFQYLKTNRYIPADYEENEPTSQNPMDYGKELRSRIEDDKELDADEQEVAKIVDKWSDAGWDRNRINLELNKITTLLKTGRATDRDKRVADLLLVHYGRQPELGTFEPAMAASAVSSLVPDIDDRISKEKLRKLAQASVKGVPGWQPPQPQQPAPTPAPLTPPMSPQSQAPRPTNKPGSSPLANRIRRPGS